MINKVYYGNTSKLVFQEGILFGADHLIVRWIKEVPVVESLRTGERFTGNEWTPDHQWITYITK